MFAISLPILVQPGPNLTPHSQMIRNRGTRIIFAGGKAKEARDQMAGWCSSSWADTPSSPPHAASHPAGRRRQVHAGALRHRGGPLALLPGPVAAVPGPGVPAGVRCPGPGSTVMVDGAAVFSCGRGLAGLLQTAGMILWVCCFPPRGACTGRLSGSTGDAPPSETCGIQGQGRCPITFWLSTWGGGLPAAFRPQVVRGDHVTQAGQRVVHGADGGFLRPHRSHHPPRRPLALEPLVGLIFGNGKWRRCPPFSFHRGL